MTIFKSVVRKNVFIQRTKHWSSDQDTSFTKVDNPAKKTKWKISPGIYTQLWEKNEEQM